MRSFSVEISATAEKQLKRLAKSGQVRVVQTLKQLATNPCPPGCRKLRGYDDVFRIRVGTYRIIYAVEKKRLLVLVLKVGHRKDIYR